MYSPLCSPVTIFSQNYCNWFSRIILTSNLNHIQTNFPQQSKIFFWSVNLIMPFAASNLSMAPDSSGTKYKFLYGLLLSTPVYIFSPVSDWWPSCALYLRQMECSDSLQTHYVLSCSQSFAYALLSTWYPLSPSATLPLVISSCPLYLRFDNTFFRSPLCHSAFPLALVSLARGPSCVFLHLWGFACISVALIILNYNLWLIDSWLYRWPNQELFSPSD